MTALYLVNLSTRKKGHAVGPVKAVPATGYLFDTEESTGAFITPCLASIRKCLPHQYRRAFDRRAISLSQYSGTTGFHFDLIGARGQLLNRVNLLPYADVAARA